MLSRSKVIEKIKKIKESDEKFLKMETIHMEERDRQFIMILEEIDNDYDTLIDLVRTARFELLVKELINKNIKKDDNDKEELDDISGS
jgi:hypothetical protein